jgi:hypothetical protein
VTDRTSERIVDGKFDLARSKEDGLRGERRCYSFKVPSTYAPATTVRRLAGTARVLSSSFDLFSKVFEQPPKLRSKTIFTTKPRGLLLKFPKFSGAANEWQLLAAQEDRASRLLRPRGCRVELGPLEFLRSTIRYGSC